MTVIELLNSSHHAVAFTIASALCLAITGYIWHIYTRTALSRIPSAHWSVPLSRAWILWTRYQKREMLTLFELHQKLGPILRIAPTEISIARHDGIKTVYAGGYNKPGYYDVFQYNDQPNAFASRGKHEHSMRRKRVTAVYAKSALFASKQLQAIDKDMLQYRLRSWLLEAASTHMPYDSLRMCYALCLDYCNAFIWGLASGSNFMSDFAGLEKWLHAYEGRYCDELFWHQEFPGATKALKVLGVDVLPKDYHSGKKLLEDWTLKMGDNADAYHELWQNGQLEDPADEPAVYSRTKKGALNDSPHLSPETLRQEIASELFDHTSGAREVFGMVLGYTIYYIARNPEAQEKLRQELLSVVPEEPATLPAIATLDKLPYLEACMKESFRLRPNSTPLPRITPSDRSVSVMGYENIPPNTKIAAFQWFVHRNTDLWDQPNEWVPERWLNEKGTATLPQMDRQLWAFVTGPRGCLGQNLTYYMSQYILYSIFTTCRLTPTDPGSFGKHSPGSLEDQLMLKFELL